MSYVKYTAYTQNVRFEHFYKTNIVLISIIPMFLLDFDTKKLLVFYDS